MKLEALEDVDDDENEEREREREFIHVLSQDQTVLNFVTFISENHFFVFLGAPIIRINLQHQTLK